MGILRRAAKAVLEAPGISPVVDAIDNPLANAKGRRAHDRELRAFANSVVLGRTYYSLGQPGYEFVFVRKSRSLGQPVTKENDSATRIYEHFGPLTDRKPAGWKSNAQEFYEAQYGIGAPDFMQAARRAGVDRVGGDRVVH